MLRFIAMLLQILQIALLKMPNMLRLIRTPDREGFFGYNASKGAYIEVISYDKLVRDAKKRNQVLFDKLFRPKGEQIIALNKGD